VAGSLMLTSVDSRPSAGGVAICGVAHVIMIISAIPSIIQAGHAIGPFALSLYMLAVGAAMFKPNIAPTVLDQNPHKRPHVITKKDGSKAIVDPEASSESVMLWFYLLINIGAFVGVATAYLAKYVGFWSSYLVPGIIYFLLPILLWVVNKRLVKEAPAGSALGDFFAVNWLCLKKAGVKGFGRKGFFERAKPSVLAASGDTRVVKWDDQFVSLTLGFFDLTKRANNISGRGCPSHNGCLCYLPLLPHPAN
jgi:hypothetical protein